MEGWGRCCITSWVLLLFQAALICLVWLNTNIATWSASDAKHTSSYHSHGLICRGQDVSTFYPKPDIILLADVVYYEEVSTECLLVVLRLALMCQLAGTLWCLLCCHTSNYNYVKLCTADYFHNVMLFSVFLISLRHCWICLMVTPYLWCPMRRGQLETSQRLRKHSSRYPEFNKNCLLLIN